MRSLFAKEILDELEGQLCTDCRGKLKEILSRPVRRNETFEELVEKSGDWGTMGGVNPSAQTTPPKSYTKAILQAVNEIGESAGYEVILDKVGEIMKETLLPEDDELGTRDGIKQQFPRWRINAFERSQQLLHRNFLKKGARRGEWELSESGKKLLEELER